MGNQIQKISSTSESIEEKGEVRQIRYQDICTQNKIENIFKRLNFEPDKKGISREEFEKFSSLINPEDEIDEKKKNFLMNFKKFDNINQNDDDIITKEDIIKYFNKITPKHEHLVFKEDKIVKVAIDFLEDCVQTIVPSQKNKVLFILIKLF
jgi:hypothetical protein